MIQTTFSEKGKELRGREELTERFFIKGHCTETIIVSSTLISNTNAKENTLNA